MQSMTLSLVENIQDDINMLLQDKQTGKTKFRLEFPNEYSNFNLGAYIKKKYNYKKIENHEKFCYQLLLNLLKRRYNNNLKNQYVCIYKKPNEYISKISNKIEGIAKYNVAMNCIKLMEELGIIKINLGYKKLHHRDSKTGEWVEFTRINKDKKTGEITKEVDAMMTTLILNDNYDEWKIAELGISWRDVAHILFLNKKYTKSGVLIRNKVKIEGSKKRKNIDTPMDESDDLVKEIKEINSYFNQKGHPELSYYRVFNDDTAGGGRLVTQFHSIPKGLRKKILEEQGWCEVDFSEFNPQLLYVIATGGYYAGDVYDAILEACDLPLQYRPIAKKVILMVIGTDNREKARKAIQSYLVKEVGLFNNVKMPPYKVEVVGGDLVQEVGLYAYLRYCNFLNDNGLPENLPMYQINPDYLLDILEEVHQPISQFFYSNIHTVAQNLESKIMLRIIHRMISMDILPITIHDCCVVPLEYKEYFESYKHDVLEEVVREYKNQRSI